MTDRTFSGHCPVAEPRGLFHHLIELAFRRKVLILSFGGPALRPTGKQFELFGCERLIVAEVAETLHRAPGRHPALQHFFLDGGSPGKSVLVLRQRKRSSTLAMTSHASRIEDARNLAIPGHRRRYDVVRLCCGAHRHHDNACEENRPLHKLETLSPVG